MILAKAKAQMRNREAWSIRAIFSFHICSQLLRQPRRISQLRKKSME